MNKKTSKASARGADKDKVANASPAAERVPLRITDTTLRDAHQSLWATRMRTADIMDIIDVVDNVGFYSLECWGGATFDVCMRFLRENPWERLRQIKAHAKKTPLQMLLRGQNLLGYKHYPDDLLERFIALASRNGIDIFRLFDALNDNRNLEKSFQLVKKYGGHAQGTICYTTSPVHTVEKYVEIAKEQEQLGADSLCIKDMAGILTPLAAERLVSALVKNVSLPIQIHTHATSGMAVSAYVEGVRAGAGAIDCAVWSMSGFSSQPPVETLLAIFDETKYNANLDREALARMGNFFRDLKSAREPTAGVGSYIDPNILRHKIPGGMISNLRSQLSQQGALDRIDEVLEELPRTRADMGYPPLVTPTSQIVGVQSVLNVLSGERYKMITQETKDYVKGLYGRPPIPVDAALAKKILGKDKQITCRPADLLKPMLPNATDNVDARLILDEEDIISFCMFPGPALEYFKWRSLPPDERPPIPADEELAARKKGQEPKQEPAKPLMAPSDYAAIEDLLARVRQLGFSELTIRRTDAAISLKGGGASAPAPAEPVDFAAPAPAAPAEPEALPAPAAAESPADKDLPVIEAPLTGTFYRTSGLNTPNLAEEGASVKLDQPICIIEAMKLFNQIKAPRDCRIVKFLVKHGDTVQKGQPLVSVKY